MTRFGMGKSEMVEIAEFMAKVLIKGVDPSRVREEVVEFRREFTTVKYGFTPSDFGLGEGVSLLV